MRILKVPVYRQSPAHCGPASLQMILDFYGREESEYSIARRAKTTMEKGTSPSNLASAAKHFGLVGNWMSYGTVRDLKKYVDAGVPVIVNWFSVNEGHYSVVVGVDDNKIVIADPETATKRKFSHDDFTRIWFDFTGDHIEKPSNIRIRSYLPLQRVEDVSRLAKILPNPLSKLERFRTFVKVLPIKSKS